MKSVTDEGMDEVPVLRTVIICNVIIFYCFCQSFGLPWTKVHLQVKSGWWMAQCCVIQAFSCWSG